MLSVSDETTVHGCSDFSLADNVDFLLSVLIVLAECFYSPLCLFGFYVLNDSSMHGNRG